MVEKVREKKKYLKDIEPREFVKFVLKVQERERRPRGLLSWLLSRFRR